MEPLDPELMSLVRAEQSEVAPTPADRERVARSLARRVGVGFGLGVGLVSGSAAGAGSTTAASTGLLLKLGLSLVVAGTAAVLVVPRLSPSAPAPASSQSAAVQAVSRTEPTALPEAAIPAVPAPPVASVVADDSRAVPSAPRALPPLADEARLLQQAQRALRDGKPAQALTALDEHQRKYPRGQLALERSAARVSALCALGDSAQARRAADRFLKEHPGSSLSAQVRASSCFDTRSR
ncbi:MAG TPA: outer membrane protein assembly factor BamD [Polyangiaceae bacterium]|nr:outer membrane protein assembly factor BamD [Polyangiaceae bacterium]